MKSTNLLTICVFGLVAFGFASNANAIPNLDPCTAGCTQSGPHAGNDDAAGVSALLPFTVTQLFKSDPPGDNGNGVIVNVDSDQYSGGWSSLVTIAAVVVKAGPNFLIQDYTNGTGVGGAMGGIWSTSPLVVGQNNRQPGVSHVTFFTTNGGPPTQTPEPGTLFLMGSGLAGLGLWRWKTKK